MMFLDFRVLQVPLFALFAFVVSVDGIGPIEIPAPVAVERRLVPVAPHPVPADFNSISPRAALGGSSPGSRPGSRPGNRPGNRPSNNRQKPPQRKNLPKLPRLEGELTLEEDESAFSLGTFDEKKEPLFKSFNDNDRSYFSQIYGFFAVKDDYLPTDAASVYAEATGKQDPFPNGRPTGDHLTITGQAAKPTAHPVEITFHPKSSTDACRAWSTLASYCAGGSEDEGTSCGCYSGTYYVPDQWNSLAASCADLKDEDGDWGEIGSLASSYNEYCPTEAPDGATMAKFGATMNVAQAEATATPVETEETSEPEDTSTPEDESTPEETPAPAETPTPTPVTTADTATITPTATDSSTTIFDDYTPTSFPFSPFTTASSSPAGSSSPRLLDPLAASAFAWISLFAAMMLF